jgi:hypothetical protein
MSWLRIVSSVGKDCEQAQDFVPCRYLAVICLGLNNRRLSMVSHQRNVLAYREHIVIVSSSLCEVPFETKGWMVS